MRATSTLKVYYGNEQRWNQNLLHLVQSKLKRECDGFDGLQADFAYATHNEALAALFIVRGLNIPARCGDIGSAPSERAVNEARAIMQETYRKEQDT